MEIALSQKLKAFKMKVSWSFLKLFCRVFQGIFPEHNLHYRLLRVVLAEFEDIE
jgi:hypothetical protein